MRDSLLHRLWDSLGFWRAASLTAAGAAAALAVYVALRPPDVGRQQVAALDQRLTGIESKLAAVEATPREIAALTERLWNEVRPLYEELHCFTRAGLNRAYGDQVQPATGPIRADLLGNLWAQEWGNVYDVVAPRGSGRPPYDLTQLLERANYTPERIVRQGESFFSSLGFAPPIRISGARPPRGARASLTSPRNAAACR